ncbi:hypothetical protein [Sorangium sp. So ce233]|uniref:hypothetical protein n=1 Tax=Sorangium sp. So ce233 TaxID=3133290 RepID=UPI003F61B439
MASKGIVRSAEKALALGLGLAWVGWHVARYGLRQALEAHHTSSALRGALERLRGTL